MNRKLQFASKLMSLAGQIDISDDSGALAYQARAELSWSRQSWEVRQGERVVAVLQRSGWSWNPPWVVSVLDDFTIARKAWSMRRHYTVQGGAWDGATIAGSTFDRSFVIERAGTLLARASNQLMSMRDMHEVEILDPDAEMLAVVALVIVKADRNNEAAAAAS